MTDSRLPCLADIDAVVFDIGDTLVHAARPGTAVDSLTVDVRPQVLDDLRDLADRGVRLAAVTDTSVMHEADVRALLEPAGVSALLEVVVTSCDVGATKPDPLSLVTCLERLGVAPTRALYIGDRVIDRAAADAAGTHFAFIDDTVAHTIDRWEAAGPGTFAAAVAGWSPDARRAEGARADALARMDALAKPPGSLGRLEALAAQLAAIAGTCPPPLPSPAAVAVFAGDHGVHASGVTAWPQEITAAMVGMMAEGRATVNALASAVGASVLVVDVGVATPLPGLDHRSARRVRAGTRDLSVEPAMTLAETMAALDVGTAVANELIDDGARCLVTGEMGIANTTPAAALIAALTGRPPVEVAGRGAGADDATLARKTAAIEAGLQRHSSDDHPLEVLASLGGFEIAAMAGLVIGAVTRAVPVVIDGVIANAALLVAERLVPGVAARAIAGHRSAEPAATIAIEALGMHALLDLDMRLGEGTGAVLALPLLEAAVRALTDVATIADLQSG
ncbi:MAG: nicotinate-nucleotide--dimethylbenzimidazole phosphoribosyltransferase [Acidimicrobiia bacterium]|nr:nicotinate-nucleotide--dimethylbenzimidazole phosphoribosyltransferase [Acidimicrobiia bacterium]